MWNKSREVRSQEWWAGAVAYGEAVSGFRDRRQVCDEHRHGQGLTGGRGVHNRQVIWALETPVRG